MHLLVHIILFLFFLEHFHVFNAANDGAQSIEKLGFNEQQRNYVFSLKSELTKKESELTKKDTQLKETIPIVKRYTSFLCLTIFRSRVTKYDALIRETEFLSLCPQLCQTMRDLSYGLKETEYVYEEIRKDLDKSRAKRPRKIGNFFTKKETWIIYMHWVLFRMTEAEHEKLARAKYDSELKFFAKLQITFDSQKRKDILKHKVQAFYNFLESQPSLKNDLRNRFNHFNQIIAEVTQNSRYEYANGYFLQTMLPNGKKDDEFIALLVWLIFRIDSNDDNYLKKHYSELYPYKVDICSVLDEVYSLGEAMNKAWSAVSGKVREINKGIILTREHFEEVFEALIKGDFLENNLVKECFDAVVKYEPFYNATEV